MKTENRAGSPPQLLTARELAAALQISVSAVYESTAKGKLPHYRLGRSVRYRLAEVLETLHREAA